MQPSQRFVMISTLVRMILVFLPQGVFSHLSSVQIPVVTVTFLSVTNHSVVLQHNEPVHLHLLITVPSIFVKQTVHLLIRPPLVAVKVNNSVALILLLLVLLSVVLLVLLLALRSVLWLSSLVVLMHLLPQMELLPKSSQAAILCTILMVPLVLTQPLKPVLPMDFKQNPV